VKRDENLRLEQDVFVPMAAARKLYVHTSTDFWRQMKTAASAVTASSLYLSRYHKTSPELLQTGANIVGPCYIDPTARIDPTAKIGPNVAIGPFVNVGPGVRVKDAIVMEGSSLEQHACVLNSIVGTNCRLGAWSRVDGQPESEQDKGQISVTVLGRSFCTNSTDGQLRRWSSRQKHWSGAALSYQT
jgi:mannose-1-phosphate guanylyltransferase